MPDHVLTEEPLQFGEGGRLFGILTLPRMPPRNAQELPVFVYLSAGLLHRVGPNRLHVRLARELAQMGFSSLRVDLAGTGDSLRRPGLTNQQSVEADFEEIRGVIESRLGRLPLVLAGLCSGANNAIRLTLEEPRVIGMVLLDPICFPDDGFRARTVVMKYASPAVYIAWFKRGEYIAWLKRRLKALTVLRGEKQGHDTSADALTLEDLPTREQLRAAFESIREREGRVLSVFTRAVLGYYNQAGQLGRVLGVDGYEQFSTELFWPQAEHTYTLEQHRRRLIKEIRAWAGDYIRSRISATIDDSPGRALDSRRVES